ncbi:GNAT family N-acetyltransferase [Clostridium sp.]|uniref:GNAT family N-acetyltransferase n=1 Tax=Clostridium sp. TaxID=1506 RepID=UPI002612DBE1|nr:GNAT family N-acetyltransferase [Clostridium sp.]
MLEKLSLNNIEIFRELYNESNNYKSYDKDFFYIYDKQNFVMKFLYRKFVKLITVNGISIGYLWHESPVDRFTRVWSLFIDPKYYNLINEITLSNFDNLILVYEELDNNNKNLILKRLGFKNVRYSNLMHMNLENYKKDKYDYEDFSIVEFKANKDEALRCHVQNEIFGEANRKQLSIEDIYMDMVQDYYIKNLCYFGVEENKHIGYGQIINNRGMHTIVNFGTIKEFRGKGLGKALLNGIIIKAKEAGIKNLYIRVDYENEKAINLYRKMGFTDIDKVSLWERK